jgi:hypothetical protein
MVHKLEASASPSSDQYLQNFLAYGSSEQFNQEIKTSLLAWANEFDFRFTKIDKSLHSVQNQT